MNEVDLPEAQVARINSREAVQGGLVGNVSLAVPKCQIYNTGMLINMDFLAS